MAVYIFPAVFEKSKDGINVRFPDIENCFTCGSTLEEAIKMAQDVLPLMLCEMEDDHTDIPEPTDIKSVECKKNEEASYIRADTLAYRKKYNTRAVKKTLPIPEWLNEAATAAGVNFSQILQDALKSQLGL